MQARRLRTPEEYVEAVKISTIAFVGKCDPEKVRAGVEDCPGLCPVCGKKLKVGKVCTCHKPETDPRWDKLKKLLENEENGGEE